MAKTTTEAVNKFSNKRELYAIPAPTDKPSLEVWHTTQPGFGARIMRESKRTGLVKRTYIARFKDAEGKDHKPPLGEFHEIDYNEALKLAIDIRENARYEKKTGKKALPTLKAALDIYISDRDDKLSDATISDYRKRWAYLKEHWDMNVVQCNSDWWLERYRELKEIGRPTADGVLRTAHAVFQSLMDDELIAVNPVRRVAAKREIFAHGEPRQTMVKAADLPKMWNWLELRAHTAVRDLVRVMLFTGLRDSVVGSLKWEQLDIKDRLLHVPAEARGNKAKKLVWIPVSDWLFENVLLPRYEARNKDNPWIIPSTKKPGAPLGDIRGSMTTLLAETGVYVHPHALRRTFGTLARQATGSEILMSRMLTHTTKGRGNSEAPAVTAGYLVTEREAMRRNYNDTATLILQLCGVKEIAKDREAETA